MQKMRKLFSLLLAVLLLTALLPAPVEAAQEMVDFTIAYTNPLYADLVLPQESSLPSKAVRSSASLKSVTRGNIEYETDLDTIVATVRQGIINRTAPITVYVAVPRSADLQAIRADIWNRALTHTGIPNEGDYLRWQYSGILMGCSYSVSESNYYLTITYSLEGDATVKDENGNDVKQHCRYEYYTTAEQEVAVTAAIAEAIDSFGFTPYTSDYCKVKTVYEYIMSICTYDYEHLNDSSYMRKHSAYAAIIDHTAVCQGYALLLYRMLLECGVDCRLISGTANGGGHAWNIVKLGGEWYNVDATWDDDNPTLPYFLNNTTFGDRHFRDADYNTAAFHTAYPMAESDYIHDGSGDFDLDLATVDLTLLLRHVAQISAIDDPEVLARVDLDNSDSLDAADITALATVIAAHTPAA